MWVGSSVVGVGGRVHFLGNTASSAGGAVFSLGGFISCNSSVRFIENQALTYGGALYCSAGTSSSIFGASFLKNRAGESGGALAFFGASLRLDGSTVGSNLAPSGGGLLLMDESSAEILGETVFSDNSAFGAVRACTFSKCSGGGVSIRGSSSAVIHSDCKFVANRASGNGAALYVADSATLTLNATLADNVANGNGGGVASDGYSSVKLGNGLNMSNNTALLNGGGAAFSGISTEMAGFVSVRSCSAGAHGGGLHCTSPISIVGGTTRVSVSSCTAAVGGGVAMEGAEAELAISEDSRLEVVENSASQDGAGLAFLSGAHLTIDAKGCPTAQCPVASRGNGVCDSGCLVPECNWDDGDCLSSDNSLLTSKCDESSGLGQILPPCWKRPLSVNRNVAQRDGGGMYFDGCLDGAVLPSSPCFFTGMGTKSGAIRAQFIGNHAAGSGCGVFSSCKAFQSVCLDALAENLGAKRGNDSKKLLLRSNTASGQGPMVATSPVSFVVLGSKQSGVVPACGDQELRRSYARGALELDFASVSPAAAASRECRLTVAPYGASKTWFRFAARSWNASCGSQAVLVETRICADLLCYTSATVRTLCVSLPLAVDPSDGVQGSYDSGIVQVILRWPGVENISSLGRRAVASFDSSLSYEGSFALVPGQQYANITVTRVDGLLQEVPPTDAQEAVSVLLCSSAKPTCNTFTSLTISDYFGFSSEGFCPILARQLFVCGENETSAVLQVSLSGSSFPSLSVPIACLPCGWGQSRTRSAQGNAWSCTTCKDEQYVLDPNNEEFTCQDCPQGASCDGNSLVGKVSGSIWTPDYSLGVYRLVYCPKGHQFVNSTNGLTFSHAAQECLACSADQYIVNSNNPRYSCRACPVGAKCDGSTMTGLANGSVWEIDLATGYYILKSCPKGYQFVNTSSGVFSQAAQQCLACKTNEYIIDSNNPSLSCQTCPVGAECEQGSLRGKVEGSVWTADLTSGLYLLSSCPPGYVVVNTAAGSNTFSAVSQSCDLCPATYYCLGGSSPASSCPAKSFSPTGSNSSVVCFSVTYVEVVLILPLSKVSFDSAKQQNFTEALARVAGVDSLSVVIESVIDVQGSSRRETRSASVKVTSNIATSSQNPDKAGDVIRRVTADDLNRELAQNGLPACSLQSVGISSESVPSEGSSLPVITGAAVGGFCALSLFMGAAIYVGVRKTRRASRRLIGAKKGTPANQRDLPRKLRKKYEAVKVLGSGSFGVVIEAWQLNNGKRSVRRAIKVIHSVGRKFSDKELRRLAREANVMSKIHSPHVVQFIESGQSKSGDVFWIIMELLVGDSLNHVLESEGCLPESHVVKIGLDICAALKEMHALNVINRDVKPENILRVERNVNSLTPSFATASAGSVSFIGGIKSRGSGLPADNNFLGSEKQLDSTGSELALDGPMRDVHGTSIYKLIDLGTAIGIVCILDDCDEVKKASASMRTLSAAIEFAGTPAYSSPECFISPDKVSFATDIWSLSASLFHLVTGQLPFDCSSPIAASINVAGDLDAKAPDVRDVAPEEQRSLISSGLAEVIARGLQKRPENRFKTVDEMASALHGCLVSRGEAIYSVFISYRVKSEKYHASLLYELLNNTTTPGGHRVIVYLDAKRLIKGEDWEEGFSMGLLNSLVALPLLSEGALEPMARLRGGKKDWKDNLAKELTIMQAMQADPQRKVETIFPVLVGAPCNPSDARYPATDSFFSPAVKTAMAGLVDRPSPPTARAAADFLRRHGLEAGAAMADSMSVRAMVEGLLGRQGAELGDHRGGLLPEVVSDTSDLWKQVSSQPASVALDLSQLCMLKAEIRALVPSIHEVIDRAFVAAIKRFAVFASVADSTSLCRSSATDLAIVTCEDLAHGNDTGSLLSNGHGHWQDTMMGTELSAHVVASPAAASLPPLPSVADDAAVVSLAPRRVAVLAAATTTAECPPVWIPGGDDLDCGSEHAAKFIAYAPPGILRADSAAAAIAAGPEQAHASNSSHDDASGTAGAATVPGTDPAQLEFALPLLAHVGGSRMDGPARTDPDSSETPGAKGMDSDELAGGGGGDGGGSARSGLCWMSSRRARSGLGGEDGEAGGESPPRVTTRPPLAPSPTSPPTFSRLYLFV